MGGGGRWGWGEVGGGMGGGAVPNVAVRFGSGRFDTILGESSVETAMIKWV